MWGKIDVDVSEIGVVIPAYNAGSTIHGVVKDLCSVGFIKDRIFIVNDGSNDNTALILRSGGVQSVSHPHNRGKGSALKTGFEYARGRSLKGVVTIDADGQHRAEDILMLLKYKNDFDMILGTRFDVVTMPYLRRLVNRTTSLVISVLSGAYVPDVQCGLRYIGMQVLDRINLCTNRYQTESELVYKAFRYNFRIGFVPVSTVYDTEKSHIHPVFDTIRFIVMAVGFLWR